MPQITIELDAYNALLERAKKAEADLFTFREARTLDAVRGVELEVDTLRNAMHALDFAVANLDPSGVIRGWATPGPEGVSPADGLERVGKALQRAPWATDAERAVGVEYIAFADYARACAAQKPSRRGQPPGPPASVEERGPQTEEAMRVHEAHIEASKNA